MGDDVCNIGSGDDLGGETDIPGIGTHTITAAYQGDTNFQTLTSAPVTRGSSN